MKTLRTRKRLHCSHRPPCPFLILNRLSSRFPCSLSVSVSFVVKILFRSFPLLCSLLFVFAGCTLGPRYNPPCDCVTDDWKGPNSCCEEAPCLDYWWEVFEDEPLNALVWQAIENNPNLYVALERVVEARANAGISRADLYPELDTKPSYSDTGMLFKIYVPTGFFPGLTPSNEVFRIVQFQYLLPLNLSYEVDLWGKLRGRYESACMSAEAEQQAYHTTLLTLTTELASNYFQLRALDIQLQLLEESTSLRREGLEISQAQFEKGLKTYTDVTTATSALASMEATLYDTMRQRQIQENSIALLLGFSASEFCLEPLPLDGPPPSIPVGIPSEVLLQRPDIAQAERNMAAQHRLIGVAYASFFPSLQLTGTLGYSSPDLQDFLSWDSRLWGMGANAVEPLFDAGRRCANLEVTKARFREACGAYQQQVLVAMQEVEDALNNVALQLQQAKSLDMGADAAARAAYISRSQYEKGLGTLVGVVDSTTSALDIRLSQAQLLGVRYLSTVQLIKALGGSWNQPVECSQKRVDGFL